MLKKLKKRAETGVLVMALVAPLSFCVFAFLGLAAYFAFREILPPGLAALVTAACGVVLIALVLVVARIAATDRGASPRFEKDRAEFRDDLEAFLREHADPVLNDWIRNNPDRAAVVTLALGIAAGYSDQFRRVLMDLYSRYAESETLRQTRHQRRSQ